MWVYHYNFKTKEYSGKSKARINPLEAQRYGSPVYLCPANATLYPPPLLSNPDEYIIVWDMEQNNWKIELKPVITTIPEEPEPIYNTA